MKKIAVYNHKGGVGKSTIAVQLSHGLAKAEYKVLLVDLDSQNNCSLFLGIDKEKHEKTFFNLIDYRYPEPLDNCLIQARPNLDLLPNSNYDSIVADFHRERRIDSIMQTKLHEVEEKDYDYVIIDCAPARDIISDAVLYYVDYLIIPVQLEAASIDGVGSIYEYLIDTQVGASKVKLIVPNMYDQRTNEAKENLRSLKKIFHDQDILSNPIHRRTKITECTKHGKTIYEYDKEAERQFYDVLERVVQIA